MALIDDLLARITDSRLRDELSRAVSDLRNTRDFGLVFENHVPETVGLFDLPLTVGALVRPRTAVGTDAVYRLLSANGTNAVIQSLEADGSKTTVARKELQVVKRFGDPIYPALDSLGAITNAPPERPHHAVINGENYHVLQLLAYLYAGEVDCIYIDPPYNSGAKDWKYNNLYVDDNDEWRHSKWLSFMQKRLALTKLLLKPDGVLIVTIDKNEHNHLGVLLEQEFKQHDITSVCIVHNPRGVQGDNFSYTNEFAVFVTPAKQKVIADRSLTPEERDTRDLRDNGGESLRTDARNCFYPILVSSNRVMGYGDVPQDTFHPSSAAVERHDGTIEVWPIDRNGIERKWRYARQSIERVSHLLSVERSRATATYPSMPQIKITKETGKYRTVWSGSRYDANTNGTQVVKRLTGNDFPYPKSVLAVRDTLYAAVSHKPNALILDFFAGSGTTFHATCLLNEEDGGSRRSIVVTNNEVAEAEARRLRKAGHLPGDAEYERHGIFESVTAPRCRAVVLGRNADGKAIDGEVGGRPLDKPYSENVEFFRVRYLDPDQVDLGTQYCAILPSLWLSAGGIGAREEVVSGKAYSIPDDSTYAVLLNERYFRPFADAVKARRELRRVWIVTDSEEAFAEMRSKLPQRLNVSMLFRDYLRNFTINTRLAQ
jgi:adenine-specific DNA-methyltransferase